MKLITRVLQSPEIGLSYRLFRQFSTRSPSPGTGSEWNSNSVESADDFEPRMFGDIPGENSSSFFRKRDRVEKAYHDRSGLNTNFSTGNRFRPSTGREWNSNSVESADDFERPMFGDIPGENSSSFFQKRDRVEKAYHDRSGLNTNFSTGNRFGPSNYSNAQGRSEFFDDLDESFTTTSDGMDGKLKKAAEYFEVDEVEIEKEDYSFRPDVEYGEGMTYDIKDLDLRKPGVQKPFKRNEFETTTEEVLQKADFRNVRFLANFITEAGIMNKRSKTRISAKAQRKIAREIKTARAFGLIPFTTMGTKQFVYGNTMENRDEDFGFQTYNPRSFVDMEDTKEPLRA